MANLINSVKNLVVVTGAGFSAPSGLPVYRGSSTGWMMDTELQDLAHANSYSQHLGKLWPHWHALAFAALDVEPNSAHHALVRWERRLAALPQPGSLTIVTQNLDGLHQQAGSGLVIEAHGTITRAKEIGSQVSFDYEPRPGSNEPPISPTGSQHTRPDIVLFGEQPRGMDQAVAAVQAADLLMFAGTSGNVWPVAGLLDVARSAGVRSLLINDEPWKSGRECDITVIDDVTALDRLVP